MNVGIHGIGIYLPENIRKNDWWPEHIVESWRANGQLKNVARSQKEHRDPTTEGARKTLSGMEEWADDPFKGAMERRVMSKGMASSDMEVAAAEDAICRAGIDREKIDLLLTYSQLPDQLIIPNATLVHHRLGLEQRCLSMGTESGCNSFLHQFALAEKMVKGGAARFALLIQSSAVQHLCRQEDPHSAWFGDGATAVVVGPVKDDYGLLSESHFTDGSMHDALQGGYPGKRWHEAERIILYAKNRNSARRMLLMICDVARLGVLDALEKAQLRPRDVDFYATHQSTRWFRKVTQEYIGLDRAQSFDSFPWTASLGACNIPFMMGMGEREGILRNGQSVAMHTGGSGIVWSGMILRWGR